MVASCSCRFRRCRRCCCTACALAQTKVGFLTQGRGWKFRVLADTEKNAKREEKAWVTVALSATFLLRDVSFAYERPMRADGNPFQVALQAGFLRLFQHVQDFLFYFQSSKRVSSPCCLGWDLYQEPDAAGCCWPHARRALLPAEQGIYRHMTDFRKGNVEYDSHSLLAGETWRCRYGYGSGWFWICRVSYYGPNAQILDTLWLSIVKVATTTTLVRLQALRLLGKSIFMLPLASELQDLQTAASRALRLSLESITETVVLGWMRSPGADQIWILASDMAARILLLLEFMVK